MESTLCVRLGKIDDSLDLYCLFLIVTRNMRLNFLYLLNIVQCPAFILYFLLLNPRDPDVILSLAVDKFI